MDQNLTISIMCHNNDSKHWRTCSSMFPLPAPSLLISAEILERYLSVSIHRTYNNNNNNDICPRKNQLIYIRELFTYDTHTPMKHYYSILVVCTAYTGNN